MAAAQPARSLRAMATPNLSRLSDLASPRPWLWGGVLLGLGLGGFFDGIVFHQILQWHNMLSARLPPDSMENMRLNMRADGLFHALTYLFTLAGLALLWQGTRGTHPAWANRPFIGTLLFGWGLFNLVEGLIDHQWLGLHHVREVPNHLAYDLAFLAWGAVILATGWALMRGDNIGQS